MLNLVAHKSSNKGTFWTKQLSTTIVTCSVLRVKGVNLDMKHKTVSGGEVLVEDTGLAHWRCKECF